MTAKLGSFRYTFAEKRERERLLSYKGYSELGFPHIVGNEEATPKRSFRSIRDKFSNWWKTVKDVAAKLWEMGVSDPRKIVFSAKMGLALMLITLLIFLKEPVKDLGRYSVWAILTVVVVFEFSIGNKFSSFHLFLFRLFNFSAFWNILKLNE